MKKRIFISATAVAKKLGNGASVKDVKAALIDAKLLNSKGIITPAGKQFSEEKSRAGRNYYAWDFESLMEYGVFSKETKKSKAPKKSTAPKKATTPKAPKKSPNTSSSGVFHMDRAAFRVLWEKELVRLESINASTKELQRHLLRKPAELRLSNGIIVRSKAEFILGQYLISMGILFSYEKRVEDITENILSDFYLEFRELESGSIKVHKIYIELWGFENDPKYLKRKEEKIKLYKDNNKTLVQLDDSFLSADFDSVFPLEFLAQYGRTIKDLRNADFHFRMAMD